MPKVVSADGVPPLPAGTRIPLEGGDIILGETLGVGGFGATYRAYDEYLDKIVCAKEFLPKGLLLPMRTGNQINVQGGRIEAYKKSLRGFAREARLLNELNHPSIVPVYSFIEANNTAYYTMELLKGRSLRDWLKENSFSAKEICQLLLPIMDALVYMHEINQNKTPPPDAGPLAEKRTLEKSTLLL